MTLKIDRRIEAIRADRVHGAGWLSRRAMAVMALAAKDSQARDIEALLEELGAVTRVLSHARPSMTPIRNAACRLLQSTEQRAKEEPDLARLQEYVQASARRLIRVSRDATRQAAEHAARFVSEGDVVMTCSYSAAVIKTLEVAKSKGKAFSVVAARSESQDGRAYGEAVARKLAASGIATQVVPDDVLDALASKSNLALVGADTVLTGGSVINGAPSLRLAQAAKRHGIPFYVVCETTKFLREGGVHQLEEGFEVIPASLIRAIITERGSVRPLAAAGRSLFNDPGG